MREDSGQALVLSVIVILMIFILVPVVGENIVTETVQVNRASLADLALAAAQAGMNDYRTYIDNDSAYYSKVCGAPAGNLALGAGAAASFACNSWEPVSGTTDEWFHYLPDSSQLQAKTGGSGGELLLEVTGRAGGPGYYVYRSVLAGYTLSGILTDSYYSDYELADPNEPAVYPTVTTTLGAVTDNNVAMNSVMVEYAENIGGGSFAYYGPETLLQALCVYHTYDENTFVDSLGLNNQWVSPVAAASFSNPYYGPYYDNVGGGGLTITLPSSLPDGVTPPNAGMQIAFPSGFECGGGQGFYPTGTVFNGIAFSTDQLALCGSPTFNGSPPIESGAPSSIPYRDDWPGSQAKIVAGKTEYFPKGYTYSFPDGCPASSAPTYGPSASPKTPELNQNQPLPPTTKGFLPYADGQLSNGCLFTGPTMIQFVPGGTMNVWSPLSQNTEPDGNPTACGTYTPGQPYQTGIAVPSGAVIYVEAEQTTGPNSGYAAAQPTVIDTPCSSYSSASPPPANEVDVNVCVPSGASFVSAGQAIPDKVAAAGGVPALPLTTCINPWLYSYVSGNAVQASSPAPDLTTCESGDAIVEGEFEGQATIASDNSIIVSRDLTYECADTTPGIASDLDPSGVAACNGAGSNDVLALVPQQQTIVAGPTNQPFNGGCTNGGATACGRTKAPTCPDNGAEPSPNISNVVPWSCDVNTSYADGTTGIVIDGAVVDLTGSTYAQNFQILPLGNAYLYQNGTNINYYPGYNGSTAPTGYNQYINYDLRLAYQNPPGLLQATHTVWNITSFVVCGAINSGNFPAVNAGTATAYQQINCPAVS